MWLNNCHKDLCYPLHAPYLDCLLHKQFNGVLLSQRWSCKLCATASASLLGQLLYLEQTVLLKLLVCCASVTQKPDVSDLVCVCVCVVFPAWAQSSGLYPFSCALSLPRTKTLPLSWHRWCTSVTLTEIERTETCRERRRKAAFRSREQNDFFYRT